MLDFELVSDAQSVAKSGFIAHSDSRRGPVNSNAVHEVVGNGRGGAGLRSCDGACCVDSSASAAHSVALSPVSAYRVQEVAKAVNLSVFAVPNVGVFAALRAERLRLNFREKARSPPTNSDSSRAVPSHNSLFLLRRPGAA